MNENSVSPEHLASRGCSSGGCVTKCEKAKQKLAALGPFYIDKNGNTLLHYAINDSPSMVFLCAREGLNVNALNCSGESALHLAVQAGNKEIVTALLMCGADPTLRNRLAQTALEVTGSDTTMQQHILLFRHGLVNAVQKGDYPAMVKLVRLWCNVHAIIKDGKSALQLLEASVKSVRPSTGIQGQNRCLSYIKQHLHTLELVHAVLCEDEEAVKHIVSTSQTASVCTRFRNTYGRTPAWLAVDQRHLPILKLLCTAFPNSRQLDCRARHNELEDPLSRITTPLSFLTLNPECPMDLWQYVREQFGDQHDCERNPAGNPAIIQAIENNCDAAFIKKLIEATNGQCIVHRNIACQTAAELGRQDVVSTIQQYISSQVDTKFLMTLAIHFYGINNIEQNGRNTMSQALKNYETVEEYGVKLFRAACVGDIPTVAQLNKACYQDTNGYTALIRAIVFAQTGVVECLLTQRPALKLMADNYGRYPLHYAYSLHAELGLPIIKLLLKQNPHECEHRVDKDGYVAAEYKDYRGTPEIGEMLYNARHLDAYGNMLSEPMGPIPDVTNIQLNTPCMTFVREDTVTSQLENGGDDIITPDDVNANIVWDDEQQKWVVPGSVDENTGMGRKSTTRDSHTRNSTQQSTIIEFHTEQLSEDTTTQDANAKSPTEQEPNMRESNTRESNTRGSTRQTTTRQSTITNTTARDSTSRDTTIKDSTTAGSPQPDILTLEPNRVESQE